MKRLLAVTSLAALAVASAAPAPAGSGQDVTAVRETAPAAPSHQRTPAPTSTRSEQLPAPIAARRRLRLAGRRIRYRRHGGFYR